MIRWTEKEGFTISKQADIIQILNVKSKIDVKKEIRNRIDFLKSYCLKTGAKGFILGISGGQDSTLADYHKGNVKARMRMVAQYAIAGEHKCLVIGTDHAAESVTGFFTKFGDGGADILPLAGLTKGQGRELLKELNAPEQLYLKIPTADLLDNKPMQADETELGVKYNVLDQYLLGKSVDPSIKKNIEKRFEVTKHKRELPVTQFDTWWK